VVYAEHGRSKALEAILAEGGVWEVASLVHHHTQVRDAMQATGNLGRYIVFWSWFSQVNQRTTSALAQAFAEANNSFPVPAMYLHCPKNQHL
jgi:hypothetical protein